MCPCQIGYNKYLQVALYLLFVVLLELFADRRLSDVYFLFSLVENKTMYEKYKHIVIGFKDIAMAAFELDIYNKNHNIRRSGAQNCGQSKIKHYTILWAPAW